MPAVQLVVPRLLMAQTRKLNEKSTKDPNSTGSQTSVFVLLSASAIGSLGFAVSLLAIWFGWLLPASLTASAPSDTSEIKKPRPAHKHHHRKSVSSTTAVGPVPTHVRRSSVPVDLAPIFTSHPEENLHDSLRRVSFAESPLTAVARRNTMPEPKSKNSLAASLCGTPRLPSSSSTPCPSRPGMPPSSLDDLNAQVSDSFSRPSRLNKLKLGFHLKTNRQVPVDKQSDGDSITSIESTVSENVTKRSSGSFVATWSNSRARTADDTAEGFASPSRLCIARLLSPGTPTTAAATLTPSSPGFADIQSPTFLSRKAERRRSTPIPRTRPYAAPYFASPPVLLDKNSYPSYLKALPQFDDEIELSSARASERGRELAVLGKDSLNSCRRVVPKRRSASEDWTVMPVICPRFQTYITIFHPEDMLDKTKGIEQVRWPDHCVANTIGTNFVEGLKTDSFDPVIHKGAHSHIESYSALKDIWNKNETELPGLLSRKKVTDIFFVGLAGNHCVKYTASDALDYGYKTWLVTDGIESIADEEAAYEGLKKAQFLTSEELKHKLTSST